MADISKETLKEKISIMENMTKPILDQILDNSGYLDCKIKEIFFQSFYFSDSELKARYLVTYFDDNTGQDEQGFVHISYDGDHFKGGF